MDIKDRVEEIVNKIKTDKELSAKFKADPVKTIEGLVGVDLPDEQIKNVLEGVKSKIDLDKDDDGKNDILEKAGEIVGGLFKKKD